MIITVGIIEAILRTGHPLLIIAEIITMIDVVGTTVEEGGVEEVLLLLR